jgi:NTP pyrophosphatase (non-canonical NTP hydrolase)
MTNDEYPHTKWKAPAANCRNYPEPTIYQRALNLWGEQAQIGMAIEELGELIVQLAKFGRRYNGSTLGEVVEEIADVEIMMEQMRLLYGDDLVEMAKRKKLARLEERLKYGEGTA